MVDAAGYLPEGSFSVVGTLEEEWPTRSGMQTRPTSSARITSASSSRLAVVPISAPTGSYRAGDLCAVGCPDPYPPRRTACQRWPAIELEGARLRRAATAHRPRRRVDRMSANVRRRNFITLLGGAAVAARGARATKSKAGGHRVAGLRCGCGTHRGCSARGDFHRRAAGRDAGLSRASDHAGGAALMFGSPL